MPSMIVPRAGCAPSESASGGDALTAERAAPGAPHAECTCRLATVKLPESARVTTALPWLSTAVAIATPKSSGKAGSAVFSAPTSMIRLAPASSPNVCVNGELKVRP